MPRSSSCQRSSGSAWSLTLRMEPTPYSTTARSSFAGSRRTSWSAPLTTVPSVSCVICPTFSRSVMRASRSATRLEGARAGPRAGGSSRATNAALSTTAGSPAAPASPLGTTSTTSAPAAATTAQKRNAARKRRTTHEVRLVHCIAMPSISQRGAEEGPGSGCVRSLLPGLEADSVDEELDAELDLARVARTLRPAEVERDDLAGDARRIRDVRRVECHRRSIQLGVDVDEVGLVGDVEDLEAQLRVEAPG